MSADAIGWAVIFGVIFGLVGALLLPWYLVGIRFAREKAHYLRVRELAAKQNRDDAERDIRVRGRLR